MSSYLQSTPLPVTVHQPSPPHAFALAGPAEGTPPAFLTDAAPTDAELDAMFASWLTDNAHRLDVCRRCAWFYVPTPGAQFRNCPHCEDILIACHAAAEEARQAYRAKRYSRINPDRHVSKSTRRNITVKAQMAADAAFVETMLDLDPNARRPTAEELRRYPAAQVRYIVQPDVDGARAMLAAARASVAVERAAA